MIEQSTQVVQHKGEFVLTKTGSLDFGEIPPEIAKIIKRQSGKIRLRKGTQADGAKGNYGENHIAIVKLTPSKNNDFYDVQTGYPSRKSGKNKKPLLWERQEERL